MENVIGIIGGMGPEAGCYLHQKMSKRMMGR
jgi:aspartate/glutamate racemase